MEWNLADLFEAVADAVPDHEALVCGEIRLTYAQLDERATRLANALADRGIGAGDHVGLWLYNGNEYLEGMLAAFKLRAVPINVNYRYVADELRYLFVDADLKAVLHEADFVPLLDQIRADTPLLKTAIARGDDYESTLADASPKREFEPRSADDVYILYTGGTTGMPKGVMWRAEDIFFGALESLVGAGPIATPEDIGPRAVNGRTRCLPACPFMHGTAHWAALATLYGGGRVVVSPDRKLEAARLWRLVVDEGVNFLVIVGDAFARPLVDALEADPGAYDLSELKILLSGGAILSPVVKEALVRLLPGVLVIDGIGASETGGQGNMIGAGAGEGPPKFMMNEDTAVLDDDLKPIAPGSGGVGRLARRGRVPLGYYKDPEKSAATFPVVDGVRWSVPGDMARVEDDGSVLLLGRGSVSINTGGEKVYPEEVEAALKAHPAIFDAVVVGVPDDRWGERVTAVVQLRPDATIDIDGLAEHARTLIAGYKVPRAMVVVDAIVRSPSGKPDYRWAKTVAQENQEVS